MVKQALYNIQKPEYFYALFALTREFYNKNIPITVVGGAAIQAHIANGLGRKTGKTVDQLDLENILRKTDDIDVVSMCEEKDVLEVLNGLKYEEEIGDDVYSIEVIRNGSKRPKVRVDSCLNVCDIMINVSTNKGDLKKLDKQYYEATVNKFQPMVLKNKGIKAELRVLRPEYVLAAKLKLAREKDIIDIENLSKIFSENDIELDYGKIKEIVGSQDYKRVQF